jgi:lysophospholipase L1-like esterase
MITRLCIVVLAAASFVRAAEAPSATTRPTLFLAGDSTVKNGTKGQRGWGEEIGKYFDKSKIDVQNHAIGGRSSRTFQTEGRWDKLLEQLKPGDFVLIQFGHNDSGPLDDASRARGTIRGVGDESKEIDNPITKKHEVVHTYGWYMRKYAADVKAKGATPIICSLVPRNDWKDGKVLRGDKSYGGWAKQSAEAEKSLFIDLNELAAKRYEQLGEEKVKSFFPDEHTHTNAAGADVNAQCVVEGIKSLDDPSVAKLKDAIVAPKE